MISSALPLTGSSIQRTPNIYEGVLCLCLACALFAFIPQFLIFDSCLFPGYGAAVLADAVPLLSSTSFSLTRGRLWADDRVSLSNTFSAYTVTFDIVDPSVPLVATLVWWDAPVSIVSPIIIANDFDLTCFPPNGTKNPFAVYTGIYHVFTNHFSNALHPDPSLIPGNGYTAVGIDGTMYQVSDRMNTNERVFIRQPSSGIHVCVVTLERQLMTGSSFAVVLTGGFKKSPSSQVRCSQLT